MSDSDCVFCDIVEGRAPADVVFEDGDDQRVARIGRVDVHEGQRLPIFKSLPKFLGQPFQVSICQYFVVRFETAYLLDQLAQPLQFSVVF